MPSIFTTFAALLLLTVLNKDIYVVEIQATFLLEYKLHEICYRRQNCNSVMHWMWVKNNASKELIMQVQGFSKLKADHF